MLPSVLQEQNKCMVDERYRFDKMRLFFLIWNTYIACAMTRLKQQAYTLSQLITVFQRKDLSVELISDSAIHHLVFVSALWSLNCFLYTFSVSVAVICLLHIQQQYWLYLNVFPEIMATNKATVCYLPKYYFCHSSTMTRGFSHNQESLNCLSFSVNAWETGSLKMNIQVNRHWIK